MEEQLLIVGNEIRFPEYISASYDGEYELDNVKVRMHIKSKTGRDLHMSGFVSPEAKEVVFRRGTLFRVLKTWYDGDVLCIEMEEP